nr:transmembrane prediction [Planctomycetota bacterium]
MSIRRRLSAVLGMTIVVVAGLAIAQPPWWSGDRRGPRELPADRKGVPDWEVDKAFEKDVFTFVRVQY